MPLSHSFVFALPNGLHARPASHLAEAVRRYASAVTFVNERTGRSANARSVLGMVGTDTRAGDPCRLEIAGTDEAAARDGLNAFLAEVFPRCDEPLAVEPTAAAAVLIPRSLRAAGLTYYYPGQVACRGLVIAPPVIVGGFSLPADLAGERAGSVAVERTRFERALDAVRGDYARKLQTARNAEAEILRAHLSVLSDPALVEAVSSAIDDGRSARCWARPRAPTFANASSTSKTSRAGSVRNCRASR